MRLLESGCEAPSEKAPAKRPQFIEAVRPARVNAELQPLGFRVRQPGGVVEASDVRSDETWIHVNENGTRAARLPVLLR
jgi:hypothetical protein